MSINSGGGDTASSTDDVDADADAERELTERDPGSGSGDDGGSGTQTRSTGITSGSGDVVTEPDVDDDGGSSATGGSRGITSGGGDTATQPDTDSSDDTQQEQQDAREELTQRDQGSDASGGGTEAAREELTQRDPGSSQFTQRQEEAIQTEARAAAEESVDTTIQEGVEGAGGRNVTIDGRTVDVQGQAQGLEARAIEEAEWADSPEDVAVVVRDGQLVAVPSRSAAVDLTTERFEEDLRSDFDRRRDRLTLQADEDGEVSEEDLEEAEAELETTEATISVPDTVPFFGPFGQGTDLPVPIDDITLSGQTRDVELEQTEEGEVEVTEAERFGDFDFGSVPETITLFGPGGMTTEIDIPGGGGEFEDFTGALGDRLVEGGEAAGDVLARELVEERTVIPGAIIEERLTGDTSFTGSATQAVPGGVAAIGDQVLNLPQETAEFAHEGVGRTVEGEGAEFAGAVGGAALGTGILTAREARRDPGRFVGQLSGSAVAATGGIAGATRLAGPRAGRAISVAVQPGEELAITAARSGVVSPRVASLVPGVRESHIGQTPGASTEVATEGAVGRAGLRERISSRTPNVRVEADPEAPVLEVDPELRQQVREAAMAPPRRARQGAVAAGAAARTGVQRAGGAARRGAQRAEEAVGAVRDADLTVPDIRGAVRGGRRRARVGDSEFLADTGTGRLDPTDVEAPTLQRPSFDLPTTPGVGGLRSRLPESELLADTGTARFQPSALETPGFARPSIDVSAPSLRGALPESEFLAATETRRFQPTALEAPSLGGGGAGFPSPRAGAARLGEGIDDFIVGAQRGPAVTGDVALQQAFIRGSDLPYPSLGQAVRVGRRRARGVSETAGDLSTAVGDAGRRVALRTPAQEADITLQRALVGDADFPRPNAPSLEAPDVTGAVRREATAARFRGAEVVSEGRRLAGDVSDLTIRVGDPPRTTLFETDTEGAEAPLEADETPTTPFESETDGEGDSGRTESDDDPNEPLDPTRTGVGIETEVGAPAMGQRLLMRSETGSESESVVEPMFETEEETGLRPTETTREEPEIQVDEATGLDVEQEREITLDETGGLEPIAETRIEIQQETGVETGVETGTETRQETRQELRAEVATEAVSELRTELDTDPLLRDGPGDSRRRRRGDEFTEEFEFGVASPEEVLSGMESDVLDDS